MCDAISAPEVSDALEPPRPEFTVFQGDMSRFSGAARRLECNSSGPPVQHDGLLILDQPVISEAHLPLLHCPPTGYGARSDGF